MSDALRSCPFCGESAAVLDYGDMIQCGNCGCVGPYGKNQIRGHGPAVADWNRRANDEHIAALDRVIAGLGEAYHDFAEDSFCETIAAWRDDLKRIRALIGGEG